MSTSGSGSISSHPTPRCRCCTFEGEIIYSGLNDRLFGAPGSWNLRKCSNKDCGLFWLDPQPDKEDIHKAYLTYYTHQDNPVNPGRITVLLRDILALPFRFPFSPRSAAARATEVYLQARFGYPRASRRGSDAIIERLVMLHLGRRHDLDFEVMYLNARPGGTLLDVGCGSGNFISGMKRRGWTVRGIDLDGAAVDVAKKAGLDVQQGELEGANFPSGEFDAVTLSHLIEHVYDPLALLKECHRIMKPGGHLVVVTPNTLSWGLKTYGGLYMNLDPPRHIHLFNPKCLRTLAKRAGFEVTSVSTTVRGATETYLGCRDLLVKGNHRMGVPQPFLARVWARAMQLAGHLRLGGQFASGEEIALLAQKRD